MTLVGSHAGHLLVCDGLCIRQVSFYTQACADIDAGCSGAKSTTIASDDGLTQDEGVCKTRNYDLPDPPTFCPVYKRFKFLWIIFVEVHMLLLCRLLGCFATR